MNLFQFVVALSAGLPATSILVNVLSSALGSYEREDDAVTANAPRVPFSIPNDLLSENQKY